MMDMLRGNASLGMVAVVVGLAILGSFLFWVILFGAFMAMGMPDDLAMLLSTLLWFGGLIALVFGAMHYMKNRAAEQQPQVTIIAPPEPHTPLPTNAPQECCPPNPRTGGRMSSNLRRTPRKNQPPNPTGPNPATVRC